MDIAALSISMNQAQLMQHVSLAISEKVMDLQQQQIQSTLEMMESDDVQHPILGNTIDVSI